MEGVDSLVPEIPVDLEDPFHAAGDQPLQVEFRGDPQKEIHPQGVVKGLEGAGDGAAGPGLHHRRFHFEKVPLFHETADQADDFASLLKNLADLRVHDQVEMALPVADLHVRQAVPFLRQRMQRFGQEAQTVFFHVDRQFARLGLEYPAGNPDDVAHVEALEKGKGVFPQLVLAQEGLKATLAVLNADEGPLAEIADGHQPSGKGEAFRHLFQLFRRQCARIARSDRRRRFPDAAVIGIEVDSVGLQGVDLFPAFFQKLTFFHNVNAPVCFDIRRI